MIDQGRCGRPDIDRHLAKLRQLSEQMLTSATQGELSQLGELLAARQTLLEEWTALTQGEATWPISWGEISRQLEEILAMDEELTGRLKTWWLTLRERLQSLDSGQRLLAGYSRVSSRGPRFIDAHR